MRIYKLYLNNFNLTTPPVFFLHYYQCSQLNFRLSGKQKTEIPSKTLAFGQVNI